MLLSGILTHMRMTFVETHLFREMADANLDDGDLNAVQNAIMENPEAGAAISGTGGARKVRVAVGGRGKRGGARVVFFYHVDRDRVYLLAAYAKSEADDLTPEGKRLLKGILTQIKKNG